MPHSQFRLLVPALLLLAGCASPNLFSGLSLRNKAAATPPGPATGPDNSATDRAPASNWTAQAGAPDGRANAWSNPYANRSPAELLAESEYNRRAGNLTSARLACEQAMRINPFDISAKYQLAKIFDDEGRFADAERNYLGILNEKPGDPDVLTSLGWSYYLQGRFDESERRLQEALAQEPQNQVAWNDLGFVCGARGNLDAAWDCFRRAGTEAQAQDRMALLTQNAGTIPASGEQPNSFQARSQAGVKTADTRTVANSPDAQFPTPRAKKLADDYKRLKAENDKQQQQRRAKLDSQRISAPSPWNNDRQSNGGVPPRDGNYPAAGAQDRNTSYGYGSPGANPGGARPYYGDPGNTVAGQNDGAFPGASPSQANRARTAESGNFGPNNYDPAAQTGFTNRSPPGPRTGQGSPAIYEQPQGGGDRLQLPIITPGPARDDSARSNPGYNQSLNSLPPDNSFTPLPTGGNVTAEYRIPEWPGGRSAGSQPDRANQPNQIQTAAGQQPNVAPGRGRNPWQDAQTTAAQVGLSAGPGSMGIAAGDWSSQQNGQAAPSGAAPQSYNRQPGPGSAPNGNYWAQTPSGSAVPAQQPETNQQPPAGQNSGMGQSQTTQGGNVSQMPGRPLAYPTIAPAVVPSAQGRVYGAGDDSPFAASYPQGSLPSAASGR